MLQTTSLAKRAKTALRLKNIIQVSKALGISTDYLLTGSVTGDNYKYHSD